MGLLRVLEWVTENKVASAGAPAGTSSSSSPALDGGASGGGKEMKTDPVKIALPNPTSNESAKVYSMILSALAEDWLLALVQGAKGNGGMAWSILMKYFERKSTANKAVMMASFLAIRMTDVETVDSYVARIRNQRTQLLAMGEKAVSEESIMIHVLLHGLPSSYGQIVSSLRLQSGLAFDDLVMHLLDHQESESMREAEEDRRGESANYAGQQRQGGQGGRTWGQGGGRTFNTSDRPSQGPNMQGGGGRGAPRTCWTCGKIGHVSRACPKKMASTKCFACGVLGHMSRDCPRNGGGRVEERRVLFGDDSSAMSAITRSRRSAREEEDEDDDEDAFAFSAADELKKLAPTAWCLDSGATRHLTCNKGLLTDVREINPPCELRVADGNIVPLRECGTGSLTLDGGHQLLLKNVAYDASLAGNLLSVPMLTKSGYCVEFDYGEARVRSGATNRIVLRVPRRGKLYVLDQSSTSARVLTDTEWSEVGFIGADASASPAPPVESTSSMITDAETMLCHLRFGHAGMSTLRRTEKAQAVKGMSALKIPPSAGSSSSTTAEKACEGCALGKATRAPFATHVDPSDDPDDVLDVLEADVCGPINIPSSVTADSVVESPLTGKDRYLAIVMDRRSRMTLTHTMRQKGDIAEWVMKLIRMLERKTGRKVKKFHTDGGGEFAGMKKLKPFLDARGIEHTTTQKYTSQHNGRCERKFRTIFDMARSMMHHAKLPLVCWPMAVKTATFLLNRLLSTGVTSLEHAIVRESPLESTDEDPSSIPSHTREGPKRVPDRRTPEEVFTGRIPNVSHLRVFGSDCFLHVPKSERASAKVSARAHRAVFIGYAANGRGWMVLDLEEFERKGNSIVGKIVSSRDVTFNENVFTHRGPILLKALGLSETYAEDAEADLDYMVDNIGEELDLAAAKKISIGTAAAEAAGREAASDGTEQKEQESKEEVRVTSSSEGVSMSLHSLDSSSNSLSCSSPPTASDSAPPPAAASRRIIGTRGAAARAPVITPAVTPRRQSARTGPSTERRSIESAHSASLGAVDDETEDDESDPESSRYVARRGVSKYEADRSHPAPKSETSESMISTMSDAHPDPIGYKRAMASPDREDWMVAMDAEMAAHDKNGTWEVVPMPADRHTRPMGNKWVYKTKVQWDGRPIRRKARLVGKGFTQVYGVDYHDTFAPVLMYKVLRLILTFTAVWDFELHQMDVETAFLNARMKEEVYMEQPEGYERPPRDDGRRWVCRLLKTLYGTKQASMEWNKEVNSFLVHELAWLRCISDPCLYHRISSTGRLMLLGLFVDDIITSYHADDASEFVSLKSRFMSKYVSKDLGAAEFILGMRVRRDRSIRRLRLDQEGHVATMLKSLGMEETSRRDTPEQHGMKMSKDHGPDADEVPEVSYARKKEYESVVGKLHYIAQSTRPDICHAVNQLSRFLVNPGPVHMQAAFHVVRYLRGTPHLPIEFGPDDGSINIEEATGAPLSCVSITAYTDSDWGGDIEDRKSTTGFVVTVYGCAVTWQSKKQATVALSTAEAEYMAISSVLQEVRWLHQLLEEIGLRPSRLTSESSSDSPSIVSPSVIFTDNRAAKSLCEAEGTLHSRTKHIDIRHHYIRDGIRSGEVIVQWCQSSDQIADILTKGLDRGTFKQLRVMLLGTSSITLAEHGDRE
jgi:transposase InsO family protein